MSGLFWSEILLSMWNFQLVIQKGMMLLDTAHFHRSVGCRGVRERERDIATIVTCVNMYSNPKS